MEQKELESIKDKVGVTIKDRKWKLVVGNKNNYDQDLLNFYETESQAQSAKPFFVEKYKEWNHGIEDFIVKPVNPDLIANPIPTDYSHYCRSLIPDSEWERVMRGAASAEINCNDMMCGGGGRTYYYLSKIIPKHFTVIDIGASYAAQSYFFQSHIGYIAVEPYKCYDTDIPIENFKPDGTARFEITAGQFIKEILPTLNLNMSRVFAICNYVPEWFGENPNELVRRTFKNVFCYYPS